MGQKSSVALPVTDITTAAVNVTETFAQFYVNEYALQLTAALRRDDLEMIRKCALVPESRRSTSVDEADDGTPNTNDPVPLPHGRRRYWPPFHGGKSPSQLMKPMTTPSRPWQEGFLMKRGKYNTEWKKRWFVLHNRDKNYELVYSTVEGSYRGSIAMTGMTVHTGPDFTLRLEPYDHSRVYYLKAADRSEQKRWKHVLQFVSKKAMPALSPNALLQITFDEAYRKTRQHLGLFATYTVGSPVELLVSLVLQQCDAVVKSCVDVLSSGGGVGPAIVPESSVEGNARARAIAQFSDALYEHVSSIVIKCWKECECGVDRYRDVLEELALFCPSAIVNEGNLLRAHCAVVFTDKVKAQIADVIDKRAVPFLTVSSRVAFKAAKAVIRTYRNRVMDAFVRCQCDKRTSVGSSNTQDSTVATPGSPTSTGVVCGEEPRLEDELNGFMASLRFPLDGLEECDSWILWLTRPKSTNAVEKSKLKLPCSVEELKSMIAPLKLRDFETAMMARTHKVAARALYTVSMGIFGIIDRDIAQATVDHTAAAAAYDLQQGIVKELAIITRAVVTAAVYRDIMPVAEANAYDSPCAGLSDKFLRLGFYSIRDSVETEFGKVLSSMVDTSVRSTVTPRLNKLMAVAVEPLGLDAAILAATTTNSTLE